MLKQYPYNFYNLQREPNLDNSITWNNKKKLIVSNDNLVIP